MRALVGVFSIFHFCSADRREKEDLFTCNLDTIFFFSLFPDNPSAQYKAMTFVGLNKIEALFVSTFCFLLFLFFVFIWLNESRYNDQPVKFLKKHKCNWGHWHMCWNTDISVGELPDFTFYLCGYSSFIIHNSSAKFAMNNLHFHILSCSFKTNI